MLVFCKFKKWEVLDECDCYHCEKGYGCEYFCYNFNLKFDKEFIYCDNCGLNCITECTVEEYYRVQKEWFKKD